MAVVGHCDCPNSGMRRCLGLETGHSPDRTEGSTSPNLFSHLEKDSDTSWT